MMSDMVSLARALRRRATDAEVALWRRLRGRQVAGVKFRRQVPIGRYIVDFASHHPRIVIELDGGQHANPGHRSRDASRDRWLRAQGFHVLRFWDNDVLADPEAVLSAILDALEQSREP